METGFRIPITRGIPDSLSRIPYSKALDSRFPMKKIPDSGFIPYKGQVIRVLSTSVGTENVIDKLLIIMGNDFTFILNGEMRTSVLTLRYLE